MALRQPTSNHLAWNEALLTHSLQAFIDDQPALKMWKSSANIMHSLA